MADREGLNRRSIKALKEAFLPAPTDEPIRRAVDFLVSQLLDGRTRLSDRDAALEMLGTLGHTEADGPTSDLYEGLFSGGLLCVLDILDPIVWSVLRNLPLAMSSESLRVPTNANLVKKYLRRTTRVESPVERRQIADAVLPALRDVPWSAVLEARSHRSAPAFRAFAQQSVSGDPTAVTEQLWEALDELFPGVPRASATAVLTNTPVPGLPMNPLGIATSFVTSRGRFAGGVAKAGSRCQSSCGAHGDPRTRAIAPPRLALIWDESLATRVSLGSGSQTWWRTRRGAPYSTTRSSQE
jgi:hypothetical protein